MYENMCLVYAVLSEFHESLRALIKFIIGMISNDFTYGYRMWT
jgi:hypothetical protein